jgi:hypothetical protein
MPRTGGAITGASDAVPVPSTGTATEVGPLTSSPPSQGHSSGGALWTPAYIPDDCPASWMYSTTYVQYLFISCYLSDNKPVLSYLLLHLLPQYLYFKETMNHKLRVKSYKLKAMRYEPSYKLQAMSYALPATSFDIQVTSCELRSVTCDSGMIVQY